MICIISEKSRFEKFLKHPVIFTDSSKNFSNHDKNISIIALPPPISSQFRDIEKRPTLLC